MTVFFWLLCGYFAFIGIGDKYRYSGFLLAAFYAFCALIYPYTVVDDDLLYAVYGSIDWLMAWAVIVACVKDGLSKKRVAFNWALFGMMALLNALDFYDSLLYGMVNEQATGTLISVLMIAQVGAFCDGLGNSFVNVGLHGGFFHHASIRREGNKSNNEISS